YQPIPVLPFHDRALKADRTFKNLLANATVTHLAPKIGTELAGIQLHELTDVQKDELALLVAERGVVFFRDQEITIDQQLELGRYYGPLHVHQNLGHPEKYPEVLVVENSVESSERIIKRQMYDPDNAWHSDVSNERQVTRRTALNMVGVYAVLKLLYKHITEGHEFQVRFRWTKNAVALWDNRVTAHYATFDYLPGNRHAVRVTTQGEIPYLAHEEEAP
ncbi:hypothetical protein BBJ28_00026908, partial [Nothophytophthora sp. Chile5]